MKRRGAPFLPEVEGSGVALEPLLLQSGWVGVGSGIILVPAIRVEVGVKWGCCYLCSCEAAGVVHGVFVVVKWVEGVGLVLPLFL